jgi:hypothetical protein
MLRTILSKTVFSVLAGIALSFAMLSGPAIAHHSFNAQYDADQPMTITGKVTRVKWENPHIYYYIEVTDEADRVTEWAIEGSAPNNLFRQGWRKDSLTLGEIVTVEGFRARNGANQLNGRKTTLSDGTRLFSGSNDGTPDL